MCSRRLTWSTRLHSTMQKLRSYRQTLCCRRRNVLLGDVRAFLEVADADGVSPAVRRLGVSKSIVSRRLARVNKRSESNFYRARHMGLCLQKPGMPAAPEPNARTTGALAPLKVMHSSDGKACSVTGLG